MITRRKVITFLIALVGAALLWLYVVTAVAPEATVTISNIPVTVDGDMYWQERGLILTRLNTPVISLEISTTRSNISKLSAATMSISADGSKIRSDGLHALTYTINYPASVNASDIEVLRRSTMEVSAVFEKVETSQLKIQVDWENAVADGYFAETGNAKLEPESIILSGPSEQLEQVASARVTLDLEGKRQTDSYTLPIQLYDKDNQPIDLPEHTKIDATETNLTLRIQKEKQLPLRVVLQGDTVIGEANTELTYEPEFITVRGAEDVIDGLTQWNLGTIELAELTEAETVVPFDIKLPDYLTLMDESASAKVTVRIHGILTDSVGVTDIRVFNAPDSNEFDTNLPKRVNILVRGDEEEVRQLKENGGRGLHLEVDLQPYPSAGSFTVEGTVVNDSHPTLSVPSRVSFTVSVTKKAQTPAEPPATEPSTTELDTPDPEVPAGPED